MTCCFFSKRTFDPVTLTALITMGQSTVQVKTLRILASNEPKSHVFLPSPQVGEVIGKITGYKRRRGEQGRTPRLANDSLLLTPLSAVLSIFWFGLYKLKSSWQNNTYLARHCRITSWTNYYSLSFHLEPVK